MAAGQKTPVPKTPLRRPVLEWVTAGFGLLVVLAALGQILSEALSGPDGPPDLSLTAGAARQTAAGWVIEVRAFNDGDETAAGVKIEGRLGQETATAELDYVPAHGEALASMRFDGDPRDAVELTLQGWREP